jgi:RHS repeat-associated protein
MLLKDGTTAYVYGPGGLPIEQVNTSVTYWFHHDQIGSTRLITDSTGITQATYTYDPYGGLASSTGSITNPFRYCGQYLDTESGFYYLRARYYDSSTGQFLSRDPIISLTRQPYLYDRGSPINGSDPDGLWPLNLQAGWNAFKGSMSDWNSWRSGFQNLSTTSHAIAGACGLAAFIPGTQEVTIPCAVVFSAVAMAADATLVAHGDMDRSELAWDAVSVVGGIGAWATVARAARCGSEWSNIVRNQLPGAGPAWKTMMQAKTIQQNWESVAYLTSGVDVIRSAKSLLGLGD